LATKCADCGRDNPVGARYCIHCGAEQSLPTPIAAAAAIASRARRGIPQAANAAHADPVPEEQPHPTGHPASPATSASTPRATIVPYPSSGGASGRHDALAAPAYAEGPRRSGIALSIVVACFFVAVGGFFAWRMFAPQVGMPSAVEKVVASATESPPAATSATEPTTKGEERAAQRETPAPPPSAAITQPTDAQSPAPAADSTQADAKVESKSSVATAQPVEITPLPAKPAARPPRKAAAPEPAQQTPPVASTVAPPPVAPAPHPAASAPIVAAAAPKATKAVDPWAKLRDELETCTREDFISRVVCGQRVRFKYCAGSWGKVPECPGSPQGDHGQ
jgi:hypothetical protein